MGFLIFAFRKMALKQKINIHQAQLMQVSRQLQSVQEQSSIMQQSQEAIKGAYYQLASNAQGQSNNIFQTSAMSALTDLDAAKTKLASSPEDPAAKKAMEAAQTKYNDVSKASIFQGLGATQLNLAGMQYMNSVFNASDNAQSSQLEYQDRQLEQRKAGIESQLKLEEAELESVEKGEDDAAKKSAPKFGLS